jgi:hypothetical protein
MEKDVNEISKKANLIPQVFYDIISRIIPGSVLIFLALFTHYGFSAIYRIIKQLLIPKDAQFLFQFYIIVLFLVAAYSLSILLMGFWALFVKISKKCNSVFLESEKKDWDKIANHAKDSFKDSTNSSEKLSSLINMPIPSLSYIYDYVRLFAPDVGARLVKVRAECHMCSVLISGISILFIWNFVEISTFFQIWRILYGIFMLSTLIFLWFFMRDLEIRFMTGLCNYWYILRSFQLQQSTNKGNFS